MAMTGASLSVIGNALNHKDVTTTRKVYAQTAREAERQARMNAHEVIFAKSFSGGPKVTSMQAKRGNISVPEGRRHSTGTEF